MKKKVFTLMVVSGLTFAPNLHSESSAQKANSRTTTSSSAMPRSLPAQSNEINELKAIAAQAFETLSPATKQWVEATAAEYASKQPAGGPIDVVWAVKTVQKKFSSGFAGGVRDGMIAVLMFSVLKDALKEKREAQRLAKRMKREELRAKGAGLTDQTKAIEQGEKEARERYDHAMAAAERDTWISLMSALASTLNTGIGSLADNPPPAKVADKSLQQAVIRKLRAQLATMRTTPL